MNTTKACFDIILQGDKEESRQAARKVRTLLYSSGRFEKDEFIEIKNLVSAAPETYKKISEDWREENFVLAVSVIYYLHDKEAQPDFLFPWLFDLLQHPRGNIRYAAVRMLRNELGPLTVYIRHPDHKPGYFGKLTPQQADRILFSLIMNLQELMADFWKPIYKRYKYINSLPASPYKSVQLVMATIVEYCGQEYLDKLIGQYTLTAFEADTSKNGQ